MTNSDNKLDQNKLATNLETEGEPSATSPVKSGKSLLAYIRSHCKILLLVLLIVTAAYLSAGRVLLSLASTQKEWFEANLSEALGLELTVGDVQGSWIGFNPILRLYDLEINQDEAPELIHSLQELDVILDIPRSLFQRQFIINRILIN